MTTLLEVIKLHKSFGGVHAVNDVSFTIEQGEILGLIGPNGSGKSTIVNLIAGTYTPESGNILFEGSSIRPLSIARRAKLGIGRTFQTPKTFVGLTVFQSVNTIALQKHSFENAAKRADEILDLTGLLSLRNLSSEKLPIEKRKWLDLARILAIDPKIIMMDEVMAGLNPAEMTESMELVKRINRGGISILFIEHVMKAVVGLCHRVIVLNEGKLLCEGIPKDVMDNGDVIKAYLGKGYRRAKD
ncbi:MAG: ABC transporter ATP-binding protein [Synergistaceae bacterium]|jgi:ABC-type branched-subunit amino acid transport system ATPase component|nr:ABC transporter ATP-binding protein [Synergistaceae bacterium]